jgi:hypothetical protein
MGPDGRTGAVVADDLCEHDMIPAYCAPCRPRPAGVLARAFHNDQRCNWLRKGQRDAQRMGLKVHPRGADRLGQRAAGRDAALRGVLHRGVEQATLQGIVIC